MRALCLIVWGLLLIGLLGCGAPESFAARELEARAPELLGPAARYRARVEGLTADRATRVQLTGDAVRLRPDLTVDTLTLTLRGVRYQRDPFHILAIERADFTGRISEAALNAYVRAQGRTRSETVRDLLVQVRPEGLQVSGFVHVLGRDLPVTTIGTVQTVGGVLLIFAPQRLIVGGLEVPGGVLALIGGLINPIADLTGGRFIPRIEELRLREGAIELAGSALVTNLP
jgi:hypothetical protein